MMVWMIVLAVTSFLRWFDSTQMTTVLRTTLRKDPESLFQMDQALSLQVKISAAYVKNA
jgi:hypothetical protein